MAEETTKSGRVVTFTYLGENRIEMTKEDFDFLIGLKNERDAAEEDEPVIGNEWRSRFQYGPRDLSYNPFRETINQYRNRQKDVLPPDEPEGVWFVYGHDQQTYPIGVFETEVEALRFIVADGFYGAQVVFWELGKPWSQVENK